MYKYINTHNYAMFGVYRASNIIDNVDNTILYVWFKLDVSYINKLGMNYSDKLWYEYLGLALECLVTVNWTLAKFLFLSSVRIYSYPLCNVFKPLFFLPR